MDIDRKKRTQRHMQVSLNRQACEDRVQARTSGGVIEWRDEGKSFEKEERERREGGGRQSPARLRWPSKFDGKSDSEIMPRPAAFREGRRMENRRGRKSVGGARSIDVHAKQAGGGRIGA